MQHEKPTAVLDGVKSFRRLYGLESELGTEGIESLSNSDRPITSLIDDKFPQMRRIKQFLLNGSRLYLDHGIHVEYSSPECGTIRELAAAAMAGEELLTDVVDAHEDTEEKPKLRLNTRIVADQLPLPRRKKDDSGELPVWGSHENYLVPRALKFDYYTTYALASHLVTVYGLTGAGRVEFREGDDRPIFSLSQRARYLTNVVSSSTTADVRPIINTRDMPHAEESMYRRLHILSGDPSMSPWATAVRFGATSSALRLIEHGEDLSDMILDDPVRAAKDVSNDMTFQKPLVRENGKTIRALEIQAHLAEKVIKLSETVEIPKEEIILAHERINAADDLLKHQGYEVMSDRADWAAKFKLAARYYDDADLTPEMREKSMLMVDRFWGDLSTSRGLARRLRNAGRFRDPLYASESVDYFKFNAPDGRAELRSRIIKAFAKSRTSHEVSIDWDLLTINKEEIRIASPFAQSDVWIPEINNWLGSRTRVRVK